MVTPVAMEPLLGYHPCSIGFLTSCVIGWGQCQVGSLTGAVASKGIGGAQGSLRMVGNHSKVQGREELDCDTDGWSRYENEDLVIRWYKVGLPSLNG